MRKLPRPVTFALLAVLALGLNVAALGEEPSADGLPDIAGDYVGKVSFKFFPLDPSEKKSHGSFPATCTVLQKGSAIELDIEVTSDEGPQQWTLTGVLGNSSFWATNASATDPLTLSGRVTGKTKLKWRAAGVLAGADELNEVRFNFAPVE